MSEIVDEVKVWNDHEQHLTCERAELTKKLRAQQEMLDRMRIGGPSLFPEAAGPGRSFHYSDDDIAMAQRWVEHTTEEIARVDTVIEAIRRQRDRLLAEMVKRQDREDAAEREVEVADDQLVLTNGRVVARAAVDALKKFDLSSWPGATHPAARPAIVTVVLDALENEGYVLTRAVEIGCPPDWQTEWVSLERPYVAVDLDDGRPARLQPSQARDLASDLVIAARMAENGIFGS